MLLNITALLVLGMHNIVVFAIHRKDHSSFYFGLFCLLYGFNAWVSSPYSAALECCILPSTLYKIDVISIMLSVPCFIAFLDSFFPLEKKKVLKKIFFTVSFTFIVLVAVSPSHLTETFFKAFFPVLIALTAYSIYTGILALKNYRNDAIIILSGIFILSAAGINDILWAMNMFDTFVAVPLATLVFTFLYSFVLSRRFAKVFSNSERLAVELVENQRLRSEMEKRVKEETNLRQVQHRLTALLHTINEPLCAVDERGIIEFSNKAFEELIKVANSDLVGYPLSKFVDIYSSERQLSTVTLELEDDEITVFLFKTEKTNFSSSLSAVTFIEQLNKNRERIQSLEQILINASPEGVVMESKIGRDLKTIDNALEQMGSALLQETDVERKKIYAAELLELAILYWNESTGKEKADLARESGLWKVHINPDGWERTQTLDKYLNIKTFPKNPRWNTIIKTADYVIASCNKSSETRQLLEDKLQQIVLITA